MASEIENTTELMKLIAQLRNLTEQIDAYRSKVRRMRDGIERRTILQLCDEVEKERQALHSKLLAESGQIDRNRLH